MNSVPTLVRDIHERGAALFDTLAPKYGRLELERSIRKGELRETNIAGYKTVSLGLKGRALLGINNRKTPSPQALLDQLAVRITIRYYETNGWTHQGQHENNPNIQHFTKPDALSEFAVIKRTDYHHDSIYRLLAKNAQTIAIKGGIIVLYVRDPQVAKTLQRHHRHRIEIRPFQDILETAHPREQAALLEVPA